MRSIFVVFYLYFWFEQAGKKIIPLLVKQNMTAGGGAGSGGAHATASDDSFDEMEFLGPLRELVSKKVGVAVEM
jgi:hypothetical protein